MRLNVKISDTFTIAHIAVAWQAGVFFLLRPREDDKFAEMQWCQWPGSRPVEKRVMGNRQGPHRTPESSAPNLFFFSSCNSIYIPSLWRVVTHVNLRITWHPTLLTLGLTRVKIARPETGPTFSTGSRGSWHHCWNAPRFLKALLREWVWGEFYASTQIFTNANGSIET